MRVTSLTKGDRIQVLGQVVTVDHVTRPWREYGRTVRTIGGTTVSPITGDTVLASVTVGIDDDVQLAP